MKICPRCSIEKNESEFYVRKTGGIHSWCKKCVSNYSKAAPSQVAYRKEYKKRPGVRATENQRARAAYASDRKKFTDRRRLYKFGITAADYDRMLASQGGRCAICGTDNPRSRGVFCVDHDHATGEIRGLLCNGCNAGLGNFRDNTDVMSRAIGYLLAAKCRRIVGR